MTNDNISGLNTYIFAMQEEINDLRQHLYHYYNEDINDLDGGIVEVCMVNLSQKIKELIDFLKIEKALDNSFKEIAVNFIFKEIISDLPEDYDENKLIHLFTNTEDFRDWVEYCLLNSEEVALLELDNCANSLNIDHDVKAWCYKQNWGNTLLYIETLLGKYCRGDITDGDGSNGAEIKFMIGRAMSEKH